MLNITKYFICLCLLVGSHTIFSRSMVAPFFDSVVIQSKAKFNNVIPPNIKISQGKIKLPTNEVLLPIIFFDNNNFVFVGNKFVGSGKRKRTLFKTNDGGKSWQDYEIELPQGAEIYQISFTNESTGWMLLNNGGMDWDESKQTWLRKTTDGGKSWTTTKTSKRTSYNEVFFTDERNGWMIGNEYSLEPTVTAKPLVYKTTDGGENWIETSGRLRDLIGIDSGKAAIRNLLVKDSQTIKVTNKYRIFESKDGGETWQHYGADFSFLRDQNAISDLGYIGKTDRIKAAQGGMTVEGRYVYLATEEKDGSWINREIEEPINLSNVVFISEKDVFLFGMIHESLKKIDWDNRKGVIYYSADGGGTFSKIYENPKTLDFSEVHKLADNKFFITGEEGLVVNIEY